MYSLMVISQIVMVMLGGTFTFTQRLSFALVVLMGLVAGVVFTVQMATPVNFWLTYVLLMLSGACTGVLTGTVFTMAALFPKEYIAAVSFGSGIAGMIMNVLRGITLTIFLEGIAVDPQ